MEPGFFVRGGGCKEQAGVLDERCGTVIFDEVSGLGSAARLRLNRAGMALVGVAEQGVVVVGECTGGQVQGF